MTNLYNIYYCDGDDKDAIKLGEVLTSHSMTTDEALASIGVDMDAFAEEQGWDGWDPDAIKIVSAEERYWLIRVAGDQDETLLKAGTDEEAVKEAAGIFYRLSPYDQERTESAYVCKGLHSIAWGDPSQPSQMAMENGIWAIK